VLGAVVNNMTHQPGSTSSSSDSGMPPRKRQVALFGLSGNPPTGDKGHVGIIKSLVATGLFHEIWVLPVYVHMFSSKRNLVSYNDRMSMCRLCMSPLSTPACTVQVRETEREVYEYCVKRSAGGQCSVGSIDVLRYVAEAHPDVELNLILGADTFQDIIAGKWKDADRYIYMHAYIHTYIHTYMYIYIFICIMTSRLTLVYYFLLQHI
jgi:nicotinic acid mononucleotide adenylyltransferase